MPGWNEPLDGVLLVLVKDVRVEDGAARVRRKLALEAHALAHGQVGVHEEAVADGRRKPIEGVFAGVQGDVAFRRVEPEVLEHRGRRGKPGKARLAHDGGIPQENRPGAVVGIQHAHRLAVPHLREAVRRRGERLADAHVLHVRRPVDGPCPDDRLAADGVAAVEAGKPGDFRPDLGLAAERERRIVEPVLVAVVHVDRERARTARPHLVLAVRKRRRHLSRHGIPIRLRAPRVVKGVERMRSGQDRSDRGVVRKSRIDFICGHHREIPHLRASALRVLHEDARFGGGGGVHVAPERPREVASRAGTDERMLLVRIVARLRGVGLAVDDGRRVGLKHAVPLLRRAGRRAEGVADGATLAGDVLREVPDVAAGLRRKVAVRKRQAERDGRVVRVRLNVALRGLLFRRHRRRAHADVVDDKALWRGIVHGGMSKRVLREIAGEVLAGRNAPCPLCRAVDIDNARAVGAVA